MKQINNHINTIDPTAINALHSESNIANDDNDNDDDSSAEILDLRRSDDGAARAFIGIIFFFFENIVFSFVFCIDDIYYS